MGLLSLFLWGRSKAHTCTAKETNSTDFSLGPLIWRLQLFWQSYSTGLVTSFAASSWKNEILAILIMTHRWFRTTWILLRLKYKIWRYERVSIRLPRWPQYCFPLQVNDFSNTQLNSSFWNVTAKRSANKVFSIESVELNCRFKTQFFDRDSYVLPPKPGDVYICRSFK